MTLKNLPLFFSLLISFSAWAQTPINPAIPPDSIKPTPTSTPATPATAANPPPADPAADAGGSGLKPNAKRIRRNVDLTAGVTHDEEFHIPNKPLVFKGRTEFVDINRIEGTDFFRIFPKKQGANGIITIHDAKTGQLLVEMHVDIRDDSVDKTMREVQGMLADVEGIEFKIINNVIYIDGFVLLPHDLVRIAQAISIWGPEKVRSIATLSPVARKKIVEYMAAEVNNPEVKITSVGESIKVEGQVNSLEEKARIVEVIKLYMPDLVIETFPDNGGFVKVIGKKTQGAKFEDFIINLITVKKTEEQVEAPPKMIQIVAHFVKFGDSYIKSFKFDFSPAISVQAGANGTNIGNSTVADTANLVSNLLPKLSWAKYHGYAKVLDTASILIQDKKPGNIRREITTYTTKAGQNGSVDLIPAKAEVTLSTTPVIKSERSGLVEMAPLTVSVTSTGKSENTTTSVTTNISVRDRQSAAFGGILKKDSDTNFGSPAASDQALITLNAAKGYTRNNSQFVVFVTPIIKSSASAGVEQVKKKFRLRD